MFVLMRNCIESPTHELEGRSRQRQRHQCRRISDSTQSEPLMSMEKRSLEPAVNEYVANYWHIAACCTRSKRSSYDHKFHCETIQFNVDTLSEPTRRNLDSDRIAERTAGSEPYPLILDKVTHLAGTSACLRPVMVSGMPSFPLMVPVL